jgi:hypothetical protein
MQSCSKAGGQGIFWMDFYGGTRAIVPCRTAIDRPGLKKGLRKSFAD